MNIPASDARLRSFRIRPLGEDNWTCLMRWVYLQAWDAPRIRFGAMAGDLLVDFGEAVFSVAELTKLLGRRVWPFDHRSLRERWLYRNMREEGDDGLVSLSAAKQYVVNTSPTTQSSGVSA